MERCVNRCAILRRLAITATTVAAVAVAYEAAWILTGQYGEVGAVLYLASCLLGGILIPIRFILLSKATPIRRAIAAFIYLIALWVSWTMVWGDLALRYLNAHELERWKTTVLFYASTIGLPLLTAFSIGTLLTGVGSGQCSTVNRTNETD
jgi:hypothetical protein